MKSTTPNVFYNMDALPEFKNPVITIGSFDGVHQGHKSILEEVSRAAKRLNGESVLITFEPHPRKIIHPEASLGLLSEPQQKIKLIQESGIDHIIVVPFTRDFSMLSAEEYVLDFLVKCFHPTKIIIGYDHKFGHSREGDIVLLKKLLPPNIEVEEISARLVEDAAISSTKIRNALIEGNVSYASEMLGREYCITGTVVHGNKLGRKLGFPTANILPDYADILIPGIGVYAVIVEINGIRYKGMMSIGYKPTVTEEKKLTIEVNILNFSNDIYGEKITVYFIEYMRGEIKFSHLDDLIEEMNKDKQNTEKILKSYELLN